MPDGARASGAPRRARAPPTFDLEELKGAARKTASEVIAKDVKEILRPAPPQPPVANDPRGAFPRASGTHKPPGLGATTLYVLRLARDKLYVGVTSDLRVRLAEHRARSGAPCAWTAAHPPLPGDDAVYFQRVLEHPAEEDALVVRLMHEKHARNGLDVVRGGTFHRAELQAHQIASLEDAFFVRDVACAVCGAADHASKRCEERRETTAAWREEQARRKRAVEMTPEEEQRAAAEEEEAKEGWGARAGTPADPRSAAGGYRRWTKEEEDRLVRELRAGGSERAIARALGRRVEAVRERIARLKEKL